MNPFNSNHQNCQPNTYSDGYDNLYGQQPNQAYHAENNASPAPQAEYESLFGRYFSFKVHGGKAAFELKPSMTRRNWHTVMLEAANSIGSKQFDWQNKTAIQLTKNELPQVCAVLLGILERFEGNAHGPENTKSFKLEWQGEGANFRCFISLIEKGKPMKGIPISPFEAMQLGHVACVQYCQNFPTLGINAFINSLKQMAKHL